MMRSLLLLALVVAPAAAASATASSAAAAWLESHKSPTDDQLKQLQGVNPEAAAIVNALLSKHMKHMRKAGEPTGADLFRSMMTEKDQMALHRATSAASPYASSGLAEVGTPVVAQAQYNPNAAANRDESAVSRLLSAVASMGGKKGGKIAALLHKHQHTKEVENPLTEDASLFEEAPKPVPVQAIEVPDVVEQVAPPPPAKHENSYLKGIDLSGDMPVDLKQPKQVAQKENSYLKGIDMSGASSLESFSFGDSAPAAPKPVVKKVAAPKKKDNAFLKFLGMVDKAPAPVEKPVVAPKPAQKTNSYLDAVKFFG